MKYVLWEKPRYFEVSKKMIFRRKRFLGFVLIFHDISERKEYENTLEASKDDLEQKFQHAQKMDSIGQLAGGISHEFNNILTIILGNAELLEDNLKEDFEGTKLLKELSQAAKNASRMTKRLLTFSRKNVIHPNVVNINTILEKMENHIQQLIGTDSDIKVTTNLDPNVGNIFIDVGLMEQILINLIVNARDAMPTGGNLEISTRSFVISPEIRHNYPEATQTDYTCIQVTDTGIGMTEEVKSHLFEPFYTTKPKGTGTGLGLSMVYGAVKQFQGFTTVSTHPGDGTSFLIYIPVVLDEITEKKPKTTQNIKRGNNELIILVEDDEPVRKITHKVLEKLGYQVLSYNGGESAIEALKDGKKEIGLLFSDLVMPGLKGNEVYEELSKYYPDLKVLYASGYTDKIIAQYGVLFQDKNFISKPFTIEDISEKIYEILHN
jgi:signal transduction histidine kinase/CheY-like chemotaxis protein